MSEPLDAVEITHRRMTSSYLDAEDARHMVMALLGVARDKRTGVRVWWEECQRCGGSGKNPANHVDRELEGPQRADAIDSEAKAILSARCNGCVGTGGWGRVEALEIAFDVGEAYQETDREGALYGASRVP